MTYCAILFQIITFWDINQTIKPHWGVRSIKQALNQSVALTFIDAEYGLEVRTYGSMLKTCKHISVKEHLEELSYFIEFNGDGKVCR